VNVSSTLDSQAERPCEAVSDLPSADPRGTASVPANVIDLRELFDLVRQLRSYPPARPRRRWMQSSKRLLLSKYSSMF
jgi:hypothetical protein